MSAASATASLKLQLQKIAANWPGDPFRPNVQLKTFLTSLAEHPNLTPAAVRAARALQNNEYKTKVSVVKRVPGSRDLYMRHARSLGNGMNTRRQGLSSCVFMRSPFFAPA